MERLYDKNELFGYIRFFPHCLFNFSKVLYAHQWNVHNILLRPQKSIIIHKYAYFLDL